MAFTQPHFTCIMILSIFLSFSFPLLPVSADDDSSSTACQYPCLPPPVVPVTDCPPPPPPLPLSPVTGYWSYPPPPPFEYNPYFSPPNSYNMKPSPPPPNPMLPWFPWYYYHKGPSVSRGNSVFSSQGSFGESNVVLLGISAVLMIL